MNVVVLQEGTFAVLSTRAFDLAAPDTSGDDTAANDEVSRIQLLNFTRFLTSLPAGRIVLGATVGEAGRGFVPAAIEALRDTLGVALETKEDKHVTFAAVVARGGGGVSDWGVSDPARLELTLAGPSEPERPTDTRTFDRVFSPNPSCILPDDVLPLSSQLTLPREHVHRSALAYVTANSTKYTGFTHGPTSPVFLLTSSSHPLQPTTRPHTATLILPVSLCPKPLPSNLSKPPCYAGTSLLEQLPRTPRRKGREVDTEEALRGKKIVCLYFSAGW